MSLLPLLHLGDCESRLSVDQPVRVLGIDLGTTNSTVAEILFDPHEPENLSCRCLPLEQPTSERSYWNPIVPSCLALLDGREWIGQGVKQLIEGDDQRQLIYLTNLFHSCKNDIGLQKTYAGAPEGYRNARDISSRILAFLYQGARQQNQSPIHTTCVTVPASFQLAQRNDTRQAACNTLLAPFLDPDQLFVKETEYRQTLSIFTPIQDALSRLDLDPEDIDLCLLVGGSCLVPQIRDTLREFFSGPRC